MIDRLNANMQIIAALQELAMAHPDQRFFQLLVNAGVVRSEKPDPSLPHVIIDEYYLESAETLKRVLNGPMMRGPDGAA